MNAFVNPFMSYSTKMDGKRVDLSAGIFKEIHKHLEERHAMRGEIFLEEKSKYVLNEMMCEAKIDFWFHASVREIDVTELQNRLKEKVAFIGV